MSQLVADCPRCGAKKTTFDVKSCHQTDLRYDWQHIFEAFAVCRHCTVTTVFELSQSNMALPEGLKRNGTLPSPCNLNDFFRIDGFISLKNFGQVAPPDHLPLEILSAFREGATCLSVSCCNAAATMFRLCIDHATKDLLPDSDLDGLNGSIRRSLGQRVSWLLRTGRLPAALKELSTCIREDGNDGAHAGTLSSDDAADILDFTFLLLERLYTEPERLRLAEERRQQRRTQK